MANTPFRDYIPEGEETGAQGKVFVDYVPDPKVTPEAASIEAPQEQPEVVKPKKKKGTK